MVSFTCNICGAFNEIEDFATEPATCTCGSNVRCRALIYLVSMELFGRSLVLRDFPRLKAIRGLGMTDKECYSRILEDRFDYTNTYYDREPRMDFTEPHPQRWGSYDFVLSSDVLEHVAPPVERALEEIHRLLRPSGFLAATVPCSQAAEIKEHFPDLNEYRVVSLGDSAVLVNRRRDGSLEIRDDLAFHGGVGATLEMRQFTLAGFREKLLSAGFREAESFHADIPEFGILFDSDVSEPVISRKDPFVMSACARAQLTDLWRSAEEQLEAERSRAAAASAQAASDRERAETLKQQMELASRSRWLRLGNAIGIGPKLSRSTSR